MVKSCCGIVNAAPPSPDRSLYRQQSPKWSLCPDHRRRSRGCGARPGRGARSVELASAVTVLPCQSATDPDPHLGSESIAPDPVNISPETTSFSLRRKSAARTLDSAAPELVQPVPAIHTAASGADTAAPGTLASIPGPVSAAPETESAATHPEYPPTCSETGAPPRDPAGTYALHPQPARHSLLLSPNPVAPVAISPAPEPVHEILESEYPAPERHRRLTFTIPIFDA